MLAILQATKQRNGEDLMEYIKRFRDIALDCYDHYEERTLVEISQFAQLLQKARKIAQSVKPSSEKRNAS